MSFELGTTGIKPGYIKRADPAWYCSHHHNQAGEDVPYSHAYLFGYAVDLEPGVRTIKLPDNPRIRILAMTVAEENLGPVRRSLPPAAAVDKDFLLSSSTTSLSLTQGRSATVTVGVTPDVVTGATVTLPPGKFGALKILASRYLQLLGAIFSVFGAYCSDIVPNRKISLGGRCRLKCLSYRAAGTALPRYRKLTFTGTQQWCRRLFWP